MKILLFIIPIALALVLIVGCSMRGGQIMDGDGMVNSYHQISQEEAKTMMGYVDGHVIVDVRRLDEYNEGHIPGAICIPNESIGETQPSELPDKNQVILVYCRSGIRSKEAAQKLFDMGYTRVYEFGGIIDWTGDVVKESAENNMDPIAVPQLRINDKIYTIDFESNSSAEAFFEKLKKETVTVDMHDYGSFEKVGDLPWSLPTNDVEITTEPGDIILYQGNKITIYYDKNTWNFTKLGHIPDVDAAELRQVLGDGNVTAEFSVEWTE